MWEDFKAFALKGNVVDLAIGLIVGGAFGKIVSSAVSDLLMPPIGKLLGGVDFSNLFIDLSGKSYTSLEQAVKDGAPVVKYGVFLNHCIDFAIVAMCCFLVIRALSRLKKPVAAAATTTKDCPECLSQIPLKAKKCSHCTSVIG